MIPALHCAITRSGVEMMNSGEAITGIAMGFASAPGSLRVARSAVIVMGAPGTRLPADNASNPAPAKPLFMVKRVLMSCCTTMAGQRGSVPQPGDPMNLQHAPNRKQRRAHAAPATLAEAMRHHRAGHLPDAERLYREFLCPIPATPMRCICWATRLPDRAQPDGARPHRTGDRPRRPQSGLPQQSRHRAGPDRAIDAAAASYRRALALRPDYPEAHNNLGAALAKLGRPAEAVNSYRRALALRPQDAVSFSNLGCALADSGEPEAAIQVFREALALRPDFADALCTISAMRYAIWVFFRRRKRPSNGLSHRRRMAASTTTLPN